MPLIKVVDDYEIWQLVKEKWCKNPISGHSWPEITPIPKYKIHGPGVKFCPLFRTVKAAEEHIPYLKKLREIQSE